MIVNAYLKVTQKQWEDIKEKYVEPNMTVRNIPEAVYPVYNLAENENDEVDIKGYYIGIS